MAATWRRRLLAGVIVAAFLGTGCNIMSLPFFLLGPEDSVDAQLGKLAPKDKNKEATVVVLVSSGLDLRQDFLRTDRVLSNLVTDKLKELCKANREKVTVVPPGKVQEFKNKNPQWRTMDVAEIGSHFNADYVIDVAVDQLSMYEKGSTMLLRGHASVDVRLVDVNDSENAAKDTRLELTYPSDVTYAFSIDDKPKEQFLREFYDNIATKIVWQFTAHPVSDDFPCK